MNKCSKRVGGIFVTTLLIILFYTGITALVVLGILLIDNIFRMLYWMWKSKYNKTNTLYEAKKIRKNKKAIFIILPSMLIIVLGIILYNLPVGFEEIIGNNKPSQVVQKIYTRIYGDGEEANGEITDKDEISNVLNTFLKYRYERNMDESRFGNVIKMMNGTKFIELDFVIEGSGKMVSYITLNITDEGIIYEAFSGQAYKVRTDSKADFFNSLLKLIPISE